MSPVELRGIAWQDWGPKAFEVAALQQRSVLLHIFDGHALGHFWDEALVAALVRDRFVPVRLHAAERPDVASLYPRTDGGLLVLTADAALIGAVDAKRGIERLRELADAAAAPARTGSEDSSAAVWTGAVGGSSGRSLDDDAPARALAKIKAKELPCDLEFLLYAAREWGDDEAEGLFLTEVGEPALEDESAAFSILALTGDQRYLQSGTETLERWIESAFDPHQGAFRRRVGVPAPLFCADDNAWAAMALMRACAFAKGHRYRDLAEKVLIYLRHKAYDPMLGMIHCHGEGRPMVYGLLADNAWAMMAFTQAYLMSGHKPYREFADELARFLFQEFWEREHGGFLHRLAQKDDPPALRVPRLYQHENAAAFEAIWRLAEIKGTANYRKWVELGLKSPLFGEKEGGLARIQDMLRRGRMDLELVGRMDDPGTEALLSAVNRLYLPRKIVSFVDPDDQDYILAHQLEAPSYPRLFGCGPDLRPVSNASKPEEVPGLITALRKATAGRNRSES